MTGGPDDGLPGPVGEVFGAFEPRFYGISFLIETPAMFQAWMAAAGMFGGAAPKRLPRFEQTCLETALEHETRHFHDALVSPFANSILMLRLQAAFNGLKVLNRSLRTEANCLPIPLTAWMAKSPAERITWLADLEADPPAGLPVPLHPVPLPFLANGEALADRPAGLSQVPAGDAATEIAAFARASASAYRLVADLMRGPSVMLERNETLRALPAAAKRTLAATMTPRNLFEASALAVQVQAAWTNIGQDASGTLLEYLLKADIGYAQVFRDIGLAVAEPRTGAFELQRISTVAVWCLLGDPVVRDDFDPAVRMGRLLRLLAGSSWPEDAPAGALWDDWDHRLELKGWRENIAAMRARTGRSAAMYAGAAATETDTGTAAAFATVLESYRADQIAVTDLLLADPDAYVDTLRYLEDSRGQLPIPMLSIECGEDFIIPLEVFPQADRVRFPRILDDGETRGWNRSVLDPAGTPRPRLLDAILELEFACKMVDVAFSEESMRPIDREVLLASIESASGRKPLLVF